MLGMESYWRGSLGSVVFTNLPGPVVVQEISSTGQKSSNMGIASHN